MAKIKDILESKSLNICLLMHILHIVIHSFINLWSSFLLNKELFAFTLFSLLSCQRLMKDKGLLNKKPRRFPVAVCSATSESRLGGTIRKITPEKEQGLWDARDQKIK